MFKNHYLLWVFLTVAGLICSYAWPGEIVAASIQGASETLSLAERLKELTVLVTQNPRDADARWELANLMEFSGNAKEAIAHYKWLADSGSAYGVTSSRIADARTHMITCRFLSQVRKKNEPATSEDVSVSLPVATKPSQQDSKTAAASRSQMTKQAGATETDTAQVRNQFGFLKELTASVAVAGGLGAAGADDKVIQSALGLLYQWIDAPSSGEPEARNRLVAGMVSALASIIVEKNLGIKVNSLMASQGQYAQVQALPDAGFASEMETEFESAPPPSEKRYEVGDGLIIVEKETGINLTGEWECEHYEQQIPAGYIGPSVSCSDLNRSLGYGCVVSTIMRINQTGSEVVLTASSKTICPTNQSVGESVYRGLLSNGLANMTITGTYTWGPGGGTTQISGTGKLEVLTSDRIKVTVTSGSLGQPSTTSTIVLRHK